MATTINRASFAVTDDDGSKTTGTPFDNSWYVALADAIDALLTATLQIDAQVIVNKTGGGEFLSLRSSDVAHGFTSITDTTTFGFARKLLTANGGLEIDGFSEVQYGIYMVGGAVTDNTTKATGAQGKFMFQASKLTGTTTGVNGANSNLFVVLDHTSARFLVDAEGDVHYDATTNANAWDDHDDVALLTGLRAATMAPGRAQAALAQWVDDALPVLERTGVVTRDPSGGRHHFVSLKGLSALMIDALRQIDARLRAIEAV